MPRLDIPGLHRANSEAWESAYPVLWGCALAVVRYKLGEQFPEEIDDVASQAIAKVAKNLSRCPQVKTEQELRNFTVSVAYDEAVSRWRYLTAVRRASNHVEPLENEESEPRFADPASSPPDDLVMARERASLIADLLANLKPIEAGILYAAYVLGQTHAEIAQIHNLPRGTVGVYASRALQAIKKRLQMHPAMMAAAKSLVTLSTLFCLYFSR